MKRTTPLHEPLEGADVPWEEDWTTLEILQLMDAEEEERKKDPNQRLLMEARGDFAERYRMDDEDMSVWMGVCESEADFLTPVRKGCSEEGTPVLSPSTSDSDMEYSPLRWDAPEFNSGDWQGMFEMYIKLGEEDSNTIITPPMEMNGLGQVM